MDLALTILQWLAYLFVFAVGLGLLVIVGTYIRDVTQTESTIRRNFPVVGRFRFLFEHLGEFFRQYFFAMDRAGRRALGAARCALSRHRPEART